MSLPDLLARVAAGDWARHCHQIRWFLYQQEIRRNFQVDEKKVSHALWHGGAGTALATRAPALQC